MKLLKKIGELFANNWGLKLIALFLAIIIFHATKTNSAHNQDKSANDRPLIQIR